MTPSCFSRSALVIVGHGSTVNADSSAPTHAHARTIRERGIFSEVHTCFWKEQPSMREVFHKIESRRIYVVPNFISEGYFTRTVIPRELELVGAVTERDGRMVNYCNPVGSHAGMTEALLRRAHEVAPDISPAETSLFIVGHGTDLNDNSARAAKDQAARIRELGAYAEVISAYMEEPPLVANWDKLSRHPNVVVVPFFIADGLHSFEDIPVLLGLAEASPASDLSGAQVFGRNPYPLRGRRLYYASAIGTESTMADVIIDQAAAFERQRQSVCEALV